MLAARPRSASCCAATAMPRLRRAFGSSSRILIPRYRSWVARSGGAQLAECARLLSERLWVRVPPPELLELPLKTRGRRSIETPHDLLTAVWSGTAVSFIEEVRYCSVRAGKSADRKSTR